MYSDINKKFRIGRLGAWKHKYFLTWLNSIHDVHVTY